MMENAAGYMIIQNTGNTNDALIGVKSEFSSTASVHKTIMEGALHRMEHVPYLEVPAGKTIIFQPLSYHVMLMSLTTPLEISQTVTLMLEFENAGWISVTAEVQLDNDEHEGEEHHDEHEGEEHHDEHEGEEHHDEHEGEEHHN